MGNISSDSKTIREFGEQHTNNIASPIPEVTQVVISKPKNTERSFALLGGVGCGKSTLANLLNGDNTYKMFSCYREKEPFGLTRSVQTTISEISQDQNEQEGKSLNQLVFNIIDQPGINDSNFTLKQQIEFLQSSVNVSQAYMSGTFLIVIDVSDENFDYGIYQYIMSLIASINEEHYNFTENAIIILTHKDVFIEKRGINMEGEGDIDDKLNTELFKMLEEDVDENWTGLKTLLNIIGRQIFVNCLDLKKERTPFIKKLFELTIPTLRVVFHGSTGFEKKHMKSLMKIQTENEDNSGIVQHRGYKLHYNFAPDINVAQPNYGNELDLEVINEVDTMIKKLNGISVFIICVSLKRNFSYNTRDLINQLMNKYKFENKREWWGFAVCCLLVHDHITEDTIRKYLNSNTALKNICVIKARKNYFHLKDSMSRIKVIDSILDACLEVKQANKGLEFTHKQLGDELIGDMFREFVEKEQGAPLEYTPKFEINLDSVGEQGELIIKDIPDQSQLKIPLSPQLFIKGDPDHQKIYECILQEEKKFAEEYLKEYNLKREVCVKDFFESHEEQIKDIVKKNQTI